MNTKQITQNYIQIFYMHHEIPYIPEYLTHLLVCIKRCM